MNKSINKANVVEPNYCRSAFTLTFAIEVVGLDVWEDRKEGWLEQGSCVQGVKLQCQLYPGQAYDLDVMIWPQTAKIWCGTQYGWVRTWQFLERRWLAFSISFAFPVRVVELLTFVATITPSIGVSSLGATAKSDKNSDVYLPPLGFGVRRYFAPVLEDEEESLAVFIRKMLWKLIEPYIPWSCFDGVLDTPNVVTDPRHQDACLDSVRDLILSRTEELEIEPVVSEPELPVPKGRKESRVEKPKEKEKKKAPDTTKNKMEIKLSGESILAGTGRIVPFETAGQLPPESPEIIILISSNNLPAQDDLSIVFLNVENLFQIPLNELKLLRTTHLYIKWQLGEDVNTSEPQPLKSKSTVNFNNHRALPMPYEKLSKTASEFLDDCFKIELHGIRLPAPAKNPQLFGYDKEDRDFGRSVPKLNIEELDFLIAITHINAKHLSRGFNAFVSGEFPLYPPVVSVKALGRETYCTNDINLIRSPMAPELVIQPEVTLQAQMTLEVSLGVVGCKPRNFCECFSRMFCAIRDSDALMTLLRYIFEINEDIILTENRENLLTGFALDTGSIVVLYIEGPRDGHILRIWEMTEDLYPKLKPVFSCCDKYSTRIYPEFVSAPVPFIVLKMFVPLSVILACPPVYARPALPLPTRSAVLKFGRLIMSDLRSFPSRCQMPTTAELKSFRLELCATSRSTPVVINDNAVPQDAPRASQQKINWNK